MSNGIVPIKTKKQKQLSRRIDAAHAAMDRAIEAKDTERRIALRQTLKRLERKIRM